MSKVLFAKQEFDDARSCMTNALSAEPDNDACRKLHAKILVQREASLASEKEIYKRMLSGNRSSTGGGGGGGEGGEGGGGGGSTFKTTATSLAEDAAEASSAAATSTAAFGMLAAAMGTIFYLLYSSYV